MTTDPRSPESTENSFNESFNKLFHQFLEEQVTEDESKRFYESFGPDKLGLLFAAIRSLGAPEDHVEDEFKSVNGFFEFIDFVTALAHSCGDLANRELEKFQDSPTNQHYIHHVRRYLSDDRFMKSILEKYPYCAP